MTEKKYALVQCNKKTDLYRLVALRNFGDVKIGDVGGLIADKHNLSHNGSCWVEYGAQVYGNAWVSGDAKVCDNARVYGSAWVCDNAEVFNTARVFGRARVFNQARVFGNAGVFGDARVVGNVCVCGEMQVCGRAFLWRGYHGGNRYLCDDECPAVTPHKPPIQLDILPYCFHKTWDNSAGGNRLEIVITIKGGDKSV